MRGRWHHPPDLDGDAAATNGPVQTLTSTSTTDQPAFTPVTTLDWRGVPCDELVAESGEFWPIERDERMLAEIAGYRNEAARRLPRARRSAPRLGL